MSTYKWTVPKPTLIDPDYPEPLLCAPGPSNVWPSVAEALNKPVLFRTTGKLGKVIDNIRTGLQYVFQTSSKLVFAVGGSGHCGMETVISNLIGPNEKLIIAFRGIWDERALNMATRYGIKTIVTKVPLDETFRLEQLESELKTHRPTALFITHGDSSTGSIQKLEGLGDLCHRYGTLLLVDTVASLVGVPFFMDEWGVDAVFTSAHKAFSGPAGITSVAFSSLAEEKINNRKHDPPFYFDAKLIAQHWRCYGGESVYHHGLSGPLVWALHQCLQEVIKETLPASWARHAAVAAHFHKCMQQLSFQFLIPKPEDRLTIVTTIVLPVGYDYKEFCEYMTDNYNIFISTGMGPTVDRALRIGLMGINSTIQTADAVAEAMAATLKALKKSEDNNKIQ